MPLARANKTVHTACMASYVLEGSLSHLNEEQAARWSGLSSEHGSELRTRLVNDSMRVARIVFSCRDVVQRRRDGPHQMCSTT